MRTTRLLDHFKGAGNARAAFLGRGEIKIVEACQLDAHGIAQGGAGKAKDGCFRRYHLDYRDQVQLSGDVLNAHVGPFWQQIAAAPCLPRMGECTAFLGVYIVKQLQDLSSHRTQS